MLVLALPPHDNHIIILVMAVNPRHRDLRPFPQAGGAHKTFHFVCSMNRTASERLVNLLNQFLEAQQDCCDSKGAGIGGRVPKPYKTLKGFLASQGTTCWATWFGQSRARSRRQALRDSRSFASAALPHVSQSVMVANR